MANRWVSFEIKFSVDVFLTAYVSFLHNMMLIKVFFLVKKEKKMYKFELGKTLMGCKGAFV